MSAAAFDDMILTALEAYTVPNRRGLPTEVYGLCFGTERSEEGKRRAVGPYHRRVVTIERVAPQLRARANHDYVVPNEHATDVQLDVMDELFPNLTPVGDFHSHPYKCRRQLLRAAGWSFSDQDERSNRGWVADMLKRGHQPRLALIVAIAGACRAGKPHYRARNVFCRSIAGVHLWLSAYRIKTDRNYSSAQVWLHAPGVHNRLP